MDINLRPYPETFQRQIDAVKRKLFDIRKKEIAGTADKGYLASLRKRVRSEFVRENEKIMKRERDAHLTHLLQKKVAYAAKINTDPGFQMRIDRQTRSMTTNELKDFAAAYSKKPTSDPVEFLEAVTAELRNRGDVKVADAMRRRMQVAEYDSPYGADDRPRLKVVEDTDPEKLDFAKNVYLTSPTKAGGSGLAGFGVSDLFRGIDQHIDQTISKARKDGLSVVDVVESTTSWDNLESRVWAPQGTAINPPKIYDTREESDAAHGSPLTA